MVDELLPGAAHYRGGVFSEKIEPLLGSSSKYRFELSRRLPLAIIADFLQPRINQYLRLRRPACVDVYHHVADG